MKDKLQTVNRYNQHIFSTGGVKLNWNNPLSKANVGNTIAGAASATPDSMYNTLDPMYHIAGGRESSIGNALNDAGVGLFKVGASTGNAPLMIAGAAAKVGGGLYNTLFGTKWNQDTINGFNSKLNALNSFNADTSSNDAFMASVQNNIGPVSRLSKSDVGKDGLLSNKVGRKTNELNALGDIANSKYSYGLNMGAFNTDKKNDARMFASSYAYGGPFEGIFTGYDDMGAINYGFMSDYLNQKRKQAEARDKVNGVTPMPAFMSNSYALGGDTQTHGADFSSGLKQINAGKSHEQNANGGVPIGVAPDGEPNLVEEGETVFNDYVFSNRILVNQDVKKKYGIPKKKDISYAELSKKIEKKMGADERPNDPISQAGLKAALAELADAQEEQKRQMAAERAREAFEALSPEEQLAVMQGAAQQEQANQEAQVLAAQEQQMSGQPIVSPEETMAMEQQGMAEQPVEAACGGKLNHKYPWGGYTGLFNVEPPYQASNLSTNLPYMRNKEAVKAREEEEDYKAWTQYVNDHWDDDYVQGYLKALDAATGGNHLFDKEGKLTSGAKDYFNKARTDGKWGYYHLQPTYTADDVVAPATPTGNVYHTLEGDEDIIIGTPDPNIVGAETRRLNFPNGDTLIYHDRVSAPSTDTLSPAGEEKDLVPVHRAEWPRYAGLFGPAVGLGMMAAGIGKPDYRELEAAVNAGTVSPTLADWKPLGDYLTYRPMDINYGMEQLLANARATDRAIQNNAGTRGAALTGILANGYNSQIGEGNLYRQALEYNDALEKQVADFNRGTNQFNAEQYGTTSRFNADALNRQRQYSAQLAMQAAQQKADLDADWYNSLYGNVAGLFKGISDVGRENVATNWRNGLATAGVFGGIDDDALVRAGIAKYQKSKGKQSANGGKIKRRRGLTF